MTNKEAIEILHKVAMNTPVGDIVANYEDFYEAFDVAIKALEENQEIRKLFNSANDSDDFYHEVRVLFEGE